MNFLPRKKKRKERRGAYTYSSKCEEKKGKKNLN
jgi:hypothetical protein